MGQRKDDHKVREGFTIVNSGIRSKNGKGGSAKDTREELAWKTSWEEVGGERTLREGLLAVHKGRERKQTEEEDNSRWKESVVNGESK